MSKENAEVFVEQYSIPWSSGYGASPQTIAAFGALRNGMKIAGYELAPTLYLVGPSGNILWSDRQARLQHRDPGPLLDELQSEIARALKEIGAAEREARQP
jgi:hypothetical protein